MVIWSFRIRVRRVLRSSPWISDAPFFSAHFPLGVLQDSDDIIPFVFAERFEVLPAGLMSIVPRFQLIHEMKFGARGVDHGSRQ